MKIALPLLFILAITCLTTGCYYDNEEYLYGICDTTNVTYDKDINPIITVNCTGNCHNSSSPDAGYNLTSYADDSNGNSGVKSSADNGSLYGSISYTGTFSHMPKGGSQLDKCSINKVKAWIDKGAPNN